MKNLTSYKPVIRINPYLLIAFAAIAAFLPVSSMLLALKNDVVAIEYPIQHFLSESLRNGESPLWFNTWAMGFPLQSILSWSFFSTPQTLIGLVFKSSVYVLHAEFIFYIITAGWAMYFFLRKHFSTDKHLAIILSCCYMLSGFTVASSQWLLYITGMTYIPLAISTLLNLIKNPSLKYSLLFSVFYYLLFTNVHIYLTIIASYIILSILLFHLIAYLAKNNIGFPGKIKMLKFVAYSGLLTVVLCLVPLYYTAELISYLNRNSPITENLAFFESNYLHPGALSSLLLPLSSVKSSFSNTEGVLLNSYLGLLPLILLPASLAITFKNRNFRALAILFVSILFLVVSFGHLTPLRDWLNILPGLSYFRNSGVLRIFFTFFIILFIASAFKNYSYSDIIIKNIPGWKTFLPVTILLGTYFLLLCILNSNMIPLLFKQTLYESFKNAGRRELTLFNSLIQLFFIVLIFLAYWKNKYLLPLIFIFELTANTLIATPYFAISSYPVKEVQQILKTPEGFPVQENFPESVTATFVDSKGNPWHNINTFRKEVSNHISMTGPLILHEVSAFLEDGDKRKFFTGEKIVFLGDAAGGNADSINILLQKPNKVVTRLVLEQESEIVLQQSYFPGWKAFYNDKEIAISEKGKPFVSARVPAGAGTLTFVFEKKLMSLLTIILHIIVISTLSYFLLKKVINRNLRPAKSITQK